MLNIKIFEQRGKSNIQSLNGTKGDGWCTKLSVTVVEDFQPPKKRTQEENDHKAFGPLIPFAKVIGLVPFHISFGNSEAWNKSRAYWLDKFGTLCSASVALIIAADFSCSTNGFVRNAIIEHQPNIFDFFNAMSEVIFTGLGLFMRVYFFFKSSQLPSLVNQYFGDMNYSCQNGISYGQLRRTNTWLMVIWILATVFENIGYTTSTIASPNLTGIKGNGTPAFLEQYYVKAHSASWNLTFSYHWTLSLLAFTSNRLILLSSSYRDLFIVICARMLSNKFREIGKYVEEHVEDAEAWKVGIEDYKKAKDAFEKFRVFLSPLVLISYFANVFFASLKFLLLFKKPGCFLDVLYKPWPLFLIVSQMTMVSVTGAHITDYANRMKELVKLIPIRAYTPEIQRFERQLTDDRVAIDGLGFFTVNRPLLLSAMGVVLTLEIVLVQFMHT